MAFMTAVQPISGTPPEQGQLARLRNRLWLVKDVTPFEDEQSGARATRVDLECLDDDRLGEGLSVIWEREVNTDAFEPGPGGAVPRLSQDTLIHR